MRFRPGGPEKEVFDGIKKPNEDKDKKIVLDEFKTFIDMAAKITVIAKVIAPFVTIITKAIGIPFP